MRAGTRMAAAAAAVGLAAGCGLARESPPPVPAGAAASRVAVLPFRTGGLLDPTGRFVADAAADVPGQVGPDAAARLSQLLAELHQPVVPAETVLRATPVPGAALYDPGLAARVGREVGAEVAVMGAIRRYVQREGSAIGVEAPASVEYQAMLVDASSGAVLASYRLDYTQKPLAADLTDLPSFLQGGGKWRTREEILDRSLESTARKVASAVRSHAATQ